MSAKSRVWIIVCGLVLGLVFWSLPLMAQDTGDTPVFILTVGSRSCTLAPAEVDVAEATTAAAEATAEASVEPTATDVPTRTPVPTAETTAEATTEAEDTGFNSGDLTVLTLSDDCANLLSQLQVPENGVLWISISLQDSNERLPLSTLGDDDFPPQLDRRGSFFGCAIQEQGEQVCHVVVTLDNASFEIDIPVVVEGAFVESVTAVPADNNNTGGEPTATAVYYPQPNTTESP